MSSEGIELQHRSKPANVSYEASDSSPEDQSGRTANNTEPSKVHTRQLDVSGSFAFICIALTIFQKFINFLPTAAFSTNTQCSWEALAVSFTAGLLNGGPVFEAHATLTLS
jgi:hypothetical protein